MAENGLQPGDLMLEITESLLMQDVEPVVEMLEAIKALGVSLGLDDFGTGYSSLGYLRRFPLDVLKLDRSFVSELGADTAADAIIAAVIEMARALGHEVVAEGVETVAQHEILRRLGCDQAQGYHFARPLPPAELVLVRAVSVAGAGLHPLAVALVQPALTFERLARLRRCRRRACAASVWLERELDQRAHDRHVLRVRRQRVGRHHPAALGGQLRGDVELVVVVAVGELEGDQRELLGALVADQPELADVGDPLGQRRARSPASSP